MLNRSFNDRILGLNIHFYTKQHQVEAIYSILINTTGLNSDQLKILYGKLLAEKTNNDQQVKVQFVAHGSFTDVADSGVLKESERLENTITVTINDNTQEISAVDQLLIAPFIPFLMIYGCSQGPCV